MRPRPVAVRYVAPDDPKQLPLIEHDDVIEAFPAERPDKPFGVGVLLRRAGRNDDLLETEMLDAALEDLAPT